MKVLIAEDDPVSLLFLQDALEESGYEVLAATDGNNAYDILSSDDAPMLAILDWMMPEMDGVSVCRKLRETVKDRYIYLIILASRQETEFVVEAINAGADDIISKPYSVEELQARLRTGRRISQLEQDLRLKATHDSLAGLYNRGRSWISCAARRRATSGIPIPSRSFLPIWIILSRRMTAMGTRRAMTCCAKSPPG